ncbi:helix-turn-helix transcriptional regulator [Streptomyces sp. CFMR 7]|uniref:helix-turn-helix domain-containing protein n=1 Tax=Streptomyces sp. CFMR 7 TaxID=1649184 RepID=UPI001C92EC5E|nr:helix-turn-helix transcriptional regulator [Streptomyces sp. CFMR 7]
MTNELGTLLRQLRARAGLTQEQLAELSEVSVRTIRRLESGRLSNPQLTTVNLLAEALGAEAEERRQLTGILVPGQPRPVTGPEAPPVSTPAPPTPTPAPAPLTPESVVPTVPRPLELSSSASTLDAAAWLAREVGRRLQREVEQHRLQDPYLLPVRWQPVPTELMDLPENIQRLQPEATASCLNLSGDVRNVVETYRSIPSGRLVILGRAGSGKTILAIRFALGLLSAQASPAPVPVIFSIGSWDPATTTLRDHLTDRLLRDHPHLARQVSSGSTLAAELVGDRLILPVLDGFDELAQGLRGPALQELNTTALPLVLTSRLDEYAQTVRAAHAPLASAAGIELTDLTVEDLTAYLPRTDPPAARSSDTSVWQDTLAQLDAGGTEASARLAQVLRTPLMIILARTMYSGTPGRNPAELLDTARFPTAHDIEEHLLAGFVPALYRRRAPERDSKGRTQRTWDPDRAQRWLGYLAHSLTQDAHDQQDLAWWKLGIPLRASTRALHVAAVSALCMATATWTVELLALPSGVLGSTAPRIVLLDGALVGLLTGTAFGIAHCVLNMFSPTTLAPSRVRLRLPAAGRRVKGRSARTFTARSGAMMLGGSVLGAGHAWVIALLRSLSYGIPLSDAELIKDALVNMLVFGLLFGLSSALVFGILAVLEAPLDIAAAATPTRLLSVNRTTATQQLLVLAPLITLTIALTGYVVTNLPQEPIGPSPWPLQSALLVGTIGGLGGSASYTLAFTAWGRWVSLSRVWLPLTGKLPWHTVAFLQDAHHLGVLRQAGAVYQFRHIRLQRYLADTYRHRHVSHRPDGADRARSDRTARGGPSVRGQAAPSGAGTAPRLAPRIGEGRGPGGGEGASTGS